MPYTPPIFNAVNADLKPAGSPSVVVPNYNAVNADLATDPTAGGVSSQTVLATGIDSAVLGAAVIRLQNQSVNLDGEGFSLSDFGYAEISNLAFGVYPDGVEGGLTIFGYPAIQYGVQTVDIEWFGIPDGGESLHDIQNYYRYVEPNWPPPHSDSNFGYAEVNYQGRFVSPLGVLPGDVSEAGVSLKTRFLNQIGWSSAVLGSHLVWDGVQTLPLHGWASSLTGSPTVSDEPEIPSDTQYIELSGNGIPIPENAVWPPQSVANKTRQLFPDTFASFAVPSPSVDQPIYLTIRPSGEDFSAFGSTYVDQTIRVLSASGWSSSYASPNLVAFNYSRDVVAGGFRSTIWGDHNAYYGTQRPAPVSIAPAGGVSSADVTFRVRYVTPAGLDSTLFGEAFVQDAVLYAYPGGIPPLNNLGPANGWRIPSPDIDFRTKTVSVTKPPEAGEVSDRLTLTHFVQGVDLAGSGADNSILPEPVIDFRYRSIYPISALSLEWGTTFVRRTTFVSPAGWDSASISDNHEFLINTRRIHVESGVADQAEYGVNTVFNWIQNISMHNHGWYDTQWNFPVAYNLKKEIKVGPFMDNLSPTVWPNYAPFVENKNRVLRTFGHQSSRVGLSSWIHNAAVPVLPAGFDATLWGADTFIAYRIRTVLGQGWDSFYNEHYTVVWNAAHVIAPLSLGDTSAFGRPNPVLNLNREVKQHSGWSGPDWGLPFIAYGVRTLFQRPFNDVPAAFPEVRHNPFPLSPVGIPWQGQVGGHELRIFRREVFPYAVNVHSVPWFGEAAVRNRNVRVFPYAYEQTTFGLQDIQNFIRYVAPEGLTPKEPTVPLIEYRTRTVHATATVPPIITQLHRIRNDMPDPPSTRTITLAAYGVDGEIVDGNGIPPPEEGGFNPPRPEVRLVTLFPEGWVDTRWGQPLVYSTAIVPAFWQSDGDVGIPTLVFTQYLFPQGSEPPASGIRFPMPRFSPFNIYAPSGDMTPTHYNPQGNGYRMDERLSSPDGSHWPVFGMPGVTNQHRAVGPAPYRDGGDTGLSGLTLWGSATLYLRRQYVYVDGIRSLRMGVPVIAGIIQYVNLNDPYYPQSIEPSTVWGDNRIAHYVDPLAPRYIRPTGFDDTGWTSHLVELLNRAVLPEGIPHRGNPQQGFTSPWGEALVGYPRRYTVGMDVQSLWGNNVIEWLHRPVYPEGWNSSSLEDGNFDDYRFPMRVIRRNPLTSVPSIQSATVFGNCFVSHSVRTVYGRGIDSYNGGAHSVGVKSYIRPDGWDSLEVGDIDRWEAGKIKPHGDDLSYVGTPRLLHPLRAQGEQSSVLGTPRMAFGVAASSVVPIFTFEGPTVTNPFGCTNRAISPLPILSTQTVPQPEVD